ncbi:hypothetical protein FKM82_031109 [Ascaphus truei]
MRGVRGRAGQGSNLIGLAQGPMGLPLGTQGGTQGDTYGHIVRFQKYIVRLITSARYRHKLIGSRRAQSEAILISNSYLSESRVTHCIKKSTFFGR